jgi:hypothetical protein
MSDPVNDNPHTADYVTVLTVSGRGNKQVRRNKDGTIEKKPGPPITEATAITVRVENLQAMVVLQKELGKTPNCVLSLGFIPGTEPAAGALTGKSYKVVSKSIMGNALGVDPDTPDGLEAVLGWHEINGERCICRLKANMVSSSWCLFDIDAVRGMPDHLANMDSDARLDALAEIIPGFADAGLVIVPSTTARVHIDDKPMDATGEHYYFQMNDADDLERFGAALLQRTMLAGFGFMKTLYSSKEPDKVVGHSPWGIADPTSFSHERIVYDGAPTVKGKGLKVADAKIEIIEGGRLDTGQLISITDDEAEAYAEKTGQRVERESRTEMVVGADGQMTTRYVSHVGAVDDRQLKWDTQIETKAGSLTLGDYWKGDAGHTRCQTPFRDSSSWNGILNRHKDGTPFVYDNGIRCRYNLSAALIEKHRPDICAIRLVALNELIKTTGKMDEPNKEALVTAFAEMDFYSEIDKALAEEAATKAIGLGRKVTAFRSEVSAEKKRLKGKGGKKKFDAVAIAEGRWHIDKPLPLEIFPAKNGDALLTHAKNYKTMMSAYGYGCSYDVIKKDVFWTGPDIDMTTDNAYQALFSKMKGLAALNGLPHGNQDLNAHLPAIAEENQINPVRDYLAALEWDGKDRFKQLAREMETHDFIIAEIALRVWFTGAAAACEHFETGLKLVQGARPSFEYVLCLLGDQGVNKTKGFLGFIPKALSKYAKDGVTLNPKNKDSVKIAVSNWLVEFGELDATFKQGEISDLKSFLSTEADELRLPYAQGYSKFKRRTAFIGTVNQDKFLKDATGNRRYLALECAKGFPMWSAAEVDQLWAQAWARYVDGAQWWPTEKEQAILDINAELFRQASWVEEALETEYAWGEKPTDKYRTKTTALLKQLKGNPSGGCDPKEVTELGHALRRLWSENGAYKDGRSLLIRLDSGDPLKVNADGGKNKGWLLPPPRMKEFVDEKNFNS